ncbi:MAG: class I SAM-dependent methyltransferase [Phycisphaerae bacterium]|nr:class I SAM-dependent methyltransferase [Phycisphaerae bacterium]
MSHAFPDSRRPPCNRADMTRRKDEKWQPPPFKTSDRGFLLMARRMFDLQAQSIWQDLANQLPLVRGDVLDVGCGAQPYRALFSTLARYRGIDIAEAKAHFHYEVPDTTYYHGDIWPVESGSVDFILCTEVMEHTPDPRKLLSEAARCLRVGGNILLTAPFSARWHYIPHDYWRFSPSSYQLLLSEAGFTDIAVYARGNAMTVSCYKTIALVLPVFLPQGDGFVMTWLRRALSIVLIPYLFFLAFVGQLSLLGRGGDDCLGYTVIARRAAAAPLERAS